MKSVQKTSVLRKLRNAEHFQIHWAMSQFLVEPVADFTELTAAFAQYKQLFQHEDVVFKHRSKMVGTQAVIAADRKRDDEFIMLRMIVKSALRSIDLEIKAAAEILMPVIDDYREVPYKSYNEATALVTNLVQDLRSTENQSAVTKMELTAAIDLLSEANEAFQTVFYQRNRWVENRKQQGNMEMIRPQVDEAFDVVVNIINSAYTMNEVGAKDADKREKLTVMIDEINQQLSNMIRAIAYRQPGYTPPDPKPEPEPGPIVPYHFRASNVLLINGRILAVSPTNFEEFADLIDVRMVGGIMDFHPDGRSNRFTLNEISYDETGTTPMSLRFIPTDDQDLLGTLSNETYTVEVVKDGVVVLTIDGVNEPEGMA